VAQVTYSGLPRPEGIIEAETVLDIGPGIRPMGWYKPKNHICVEPYGPYADMLEAAGYEVWRQTAEQALQCDAWFDAIYMLDVIEHMTREEGEAVLDLAVGRGAQIVVATPNGYLPQHGDAWDMGGEYWQEHRSGWVPADFPGWRISYYDNGTRQRGFVAICDP
jgi:hypothetical protein